ncbi:hypothetical protein [Streptomyces sp. NPDC001665]
MTTTWTASAPLGHRDIEGKTAPYRNGALITPMMIQIRNVPLNIFR